MEAFPQSNLDVLTEFFVNDQLTVHVSLWMAKDTSEELKTRLLKKTIDEKKIFRIEQQILEWFWIEAFLT